MSFSFFLTKNIPSFLLHFLLFNLLDLVLLLDSLRLFLLVLHLNLLRFILYLTDLLLL